MREYEKPEITDYGTVESVTEYHKEGTEFDDHEDTQDRSSSI
jgi:hypothetical protein